MSFSKYCFAHDPASSDGIVLCAYLLSRVQFFVTPWAVGTQAPLSMGFPLGKNTEWFAMPFPGGLPNPGIELRSLTSKLDSLPSQPPEKPKNTGVGSLSLLQGIFPTQESNWGLLHCKQALYQLSYLGSPVRNNILMDSETISK